MAVFAVLTATRQAVPVPNDTLLARSAQIVWGSADLAWIGRIWPPIPVGLASLVGSSALALAVFGALASGGLLQALAERMVLGRQPWWLIALVLAAISATPVMAFLATADLGEFLALVLLAMAMTGFLRFVLSGRTEGGFQAGLLLGLATACDITMVVYALVLAAAGPLLARHRYAGRPAAARSTVAVIVFPSLAAAACWAFLEWRFTPLYLVVGALLLRRSAMAAVGYLLPLPALALTLWLGLRPPTGLSVALLGCLAVLALPARPRLPMQVALAATVLVQWVLVVLVGPLWNSAADIWWQHLIG